MVFPILTNKSSEGYLIRVKDATVILPVPERNDVLFYKEKDGRFKPLELSHVYKNVNLAREINRCIGEKVIFYPLKDIHDSTSLDNLLGYDSELVFSFDVHSCTEGEEVYRKIKARELNPFLKIDAKRVINFIKRYTGYGK